MKDISSKNLEAINEVFAEIFNIFAFDNENLKIDAEMLEDAPTESFFTDVDGNPRNMFRDIFKKYKSQNLVLVSLGLENESKIERPMPIRLMGYAYTEYKRQLDKYTQRRRELLRLKKNASKKEEKDFVEKELNELGEFCLIPTVTLVLNFDDRKWNQPVSLKGLTGNNPYGKYMEDFGIKVIDIKHLSKDIRNRFTTDFRHVLNCLCENQIPQEDLSKQLMYPLETLDMLIAYTGNKRLEDIREEICMKEMKGEKVMLDEFLDGIEKNAIIKSMKTALKLGSSEEFIISMLTENLQISKEEAEKIFHEEILESELVSQ